MLLQILYYVHWGQRREASLMEVLYSAHLTILGLLLVVLPILVHSSHPLQFHYYQNSCPQAETVVRRIMQQQFKIDPSIPAGLLRLHFHDCFIRGCDASVLIDSRGENIAEKEAPPNLSLRGFELIDKIKTELEKQCKGVVSCSDILALATRDGVALAGGSSYHLPTGRKDGIVSSLFEVIIPGPSKPLDTVLTMFQNIGLDLDDLTTLLGAHAIGFCHCGFFVDRLYNFRGMGISDPDMDPSVRGLLMKKCPKSTNQIFNISKDPTVFISPTSQNPFKLDTSFYKGVLNGEAVLKLDQNLAFTDMTQGLASRYIRQPNVFRRKFAKAMIKLGNVGVLTGQQGEVRLNCRRVNKQ